MKTNKPGRRRPAKKLDFDRVLRRRKAVFLQEIAPKFCDSLFISYRSDEYQFGFLGIDYRYAQQRDNGVQLLSAWIFGGWNRAGRGDRSKTGYGRGSKAKAFGPLLVLVDNAISILFGRQSPFVFTTKPFELHGQRRPAEIGM